MPDSLWGYRLRVAPRPRAIFVGQALAVALIFAASCTRPVTAPPAPLPSASQTAPARAVNIALTPSALPRSPSYRGVTTEDPRLKILDHPVAGSGKAASLPMLNPLGQRLVLLVSDERTDAQGKTWFEVSIPERPNGARGWVPGSIVRVVPLDEHIEVDLSDATLELYRDDAVVLRARVGIGQRQWPTPIGTFYVWAKVPQDGATGAYGVYALGLSGFSPVLSDWPGGGRAAIHGTPAPWDRGRQVSHGCVRVFNPDMRVLKHVAMGTPVIIRR